MELGKLGGIIPGRRSCFDLLTLIEAEYDVSLSFWLDIASVTEGVYEYWVYANGSGDVFDIVHTRGGVSRARVSEANEGCIYPAIWAVLLKLESELSKVKKRRSESALP